MSCTHFKMAINIAYLHAVQYAWDSMMRVESRRSVTKAIVLIFMAGCLN